MNLSDCFNNYIGLRGACNDVTPISGIYINDIAGINLKMMANLATEDQQNFQGVFDEIYTRSLIEMEGDILAKMQKFFKTNILLDNEQSGFIKTPHEAEPSANELRGQRINILETKNTELFINYVQVYLSAVTDSEGNIFVYDANDGTLLDTVSFTATTGLNTIQINKSYTINGQRQRLFICYDGNIGDSINIGSFESRSSGNIAVVSGGRITVGSSVLDDDITVDGNSRGLIINYNVNCSISNFICQNRNSFKIALWYKLGANIMQERKITDRINKYTMNNKEDAEQIMNTLMDRYNENLTSVLDNLEPHGDSMCFPCEKRRNYKYSIP